MRFSLGQCVAIRDAAEVPEGCREDPTTEYQALLDAGATHAEAIEQIRIANQPIGLPTATTA